MGYEQGKVYRLVCNRTGKQYIGSTINTFPKRLYRHKYDYELWKQGTPVKNCTSVEIIDGGDYEMVLIENYPCADKNELEARERYWIETLECVNKYIPTRTSKEWYEANREQLLSRGKEYYQNNKEEIKEYQKKHYLHNREQKVEYQRQYYQNHQEEAKEKRKVYCEANKEKIADKVKQYCEANKEKIQAWKTERVVCECGRSVRRDHVSTHRRSKIHQEAMVKN